MIFFKRCDIILFSLTDHIVDKKRRYIMEPMYLSISQEKTGSKIKRLIKENGYTVKDIQRVLGFENPQAIYKWMAGKTLPSIDNLVILSRIFNIKIEEILVVDGDFVIMKKYLLI